MILRPKFAKTLNFLNASKFEKVILVYLLTNLIQLQNKFPLRKFHKFSYWYNCICHVTS